jgi:tRNA modification GTPase
VETIVACLTPPGKAAIATIAVRGSNAWALARTLFQPLKGDLPDVPSVGRFWFGRFGAEHRDDVVLAAKENGIEIHCHGGLEVVRLIEELLVERGATLVPWEMFFGPAAPLHSMLTQAPTARSASILLDQVNGAWDKSRRKDVQRLAQLIPLGQHLVEPWKVVLAGAPNVGKSSLMNALAGFPRSIVTPTPGTTRDVVTLRVAIDGWPIELTDTAGIRATESDLERQGIERALAAVRDADLRIWLLDGSEPPILPEFAARWQFVINKIDLPAAWDWRQIDGAVLISAQTQAGLAELCEVMSRALVPQPPPAPHEPVPCTSEQIAWVRSQIQSTGIV